MNTIKSVWRWVGVVVLFVVVISNYLVMPALGIQHADIPTGFWTFMTFYFTTYIASRGLEKITGVEK